MVTAESDQPDGDEDQGEAASLLQHSLGNHGDKHSQPLVDLLRVSLIRVAEASNVGPLVIPD